MITDPNFEHYARYGKQIEDSLYTATYQAYRHRDSVTVNRNFLTSTTNFPNGLNRAKFIFVHALSRLATAPTQELIEELRELVSKFPDSDVSEMAGMIVKGLEEGRQPGSGTFDLGSLWDRRTAGADAALDESTKARKFTDERTTPYLFVLAYPTDSISDNQLLYEMAHFNFTTFVVRGFDMSIVKEKGLNKFIVAGFNSYDEVHAYAQRVFRSKELLPLMQKGKVLLISKANLELVGTAFSINDYQKFYDAHLAPIKLPDAQPMEQAPIEQHYEDEYSTEELERQNNNSSTNDDEGEWY